MDRLFLGRYEGLSYSDLEERVLIMFQRSHLSRLEKEFLARDLLSLWSSGKPLDLSKLTKTPPTR